MDRRTVLKSVMAAMLTACGMRLHPAHAFGLRSRCDVCSKPATQYTRDAMQVYLPDGTATQRPFPNYHARCNEHQRGWFIYRQDGSPVLSSRFLAQLQSGFMTVREMRIAEKS